MKPIKIAVIPDSQVKPEQDFSFLEAIGNYIVAKQPDAIVHLGDFADMPSLSSYDKGKKSFEGRRYKADVEAARSAMSVLLNPMYRYNDTHSRNKKRKYSPHMLMLTGNHECYDDRTEVLTENGWKLIKDVEQERVLTVNGSKSEWQYPTYKVQKPYKGDMLLHQSRTVDMCVTPGHRVFWETTTGSVCWDIAENSPSHANVVVSSHKATGLTVRTDEQLRFCAVACTDSHHSNPYVTFYQAEGKHSHIEDIIKKAGVTITSHRVRDRDIKEVCGKVLKKRPKVAHEYSMVRPSWCPEGNTRLPSFVYDLSDTQFSVFLDTLIFCDGTIPTRAKASLVFYGKKAMCEDVQAACVMHGYRATLTEYRENQWRVNITKTYLCRVENWLKTKVAYDGMVYCLTVPNGTLMTRRNYKPVFSGNCRILRAINDDPKLDGTIGLSDLHYEQCGWEVSPFLKVEQVAGICFSHYFVSGVMGRPITSAQALLTKKHVSCIAGHQQGKQISTAVRGDGKRITGIIAGSGYLDHEEYLGPQGNEHWRGIVMCYEAIDGQFDEGFVSLDYLMSKYR